MVPLVKDNRSILITYNCMVITIYNIKTEDLILPIDQSASRDLYTIESCHYFSSY